MSTAEERLARLEVLVPELRDDIKELKTMVGDQRDQIMELLKAVHSAKGGWLMLASMSACVGAVISWFILWWTHK